MTTAFVLSGGASLGSIQVGMAMALEEAKIRPDMVVGVSVSAINGAWLSAKKPANGTISSTTTVCVDSFVAMSASLASKLLGSRNSCDPC